MKHSFTRNEFLKAFPAGLGVGSVLGAQQGKPAAPVKRATPVRRAGRKGNLLFFFGDEQSPVTGAVIPVLSWLAGKSGIDFEAYVCIRPKTWAGRILALNGHGHREQFYYLANFYDKVLYCSLTESPAVQFKREVMAFGGDIVSARKPAEVAEFYLDVLGYFRARCPEEIILLPSRPLSDKEIWIQPYCYPDVYHRQALAITPDAPAALKKLKAAGVKRATLLYCPEAASEAARSAGLNVSTLDSIQPGDTYGALTCRIADRSIKHAKGIAFADPHCTLKWQSHYLREGLLSLYEPVEWRAFAKTVAKYARQAGDHLILGNQMVQPMSDNVITAFSKENLVMSLAGLDARIGTSLQTRTPLPVDWLSKVPACWEAEAEYSDGFLLEQARQGRTPVTFLLYAADAGHLPALHRVLDLMLVEGLRCGLAFPSTWYDFQPQLIEQLYIPMDLGGVYPNVEPMLVSAGEGVATEAEGYLSPEVLRASFQRARKTIVKHVGERHVPIGYYSFQDACPDYKHKTARSPFGTFRAAGIQYMFTYEQENSDPAVVHESGKFIALNQQNNHWFGNVNFSLVDRLKTWEKQIAGKAPGGWIALGFDLPFYGLCPRYLRAMNLLMETMMYAAAGGEQKKLFIAKPHEVVRYARLVRSGAAR